MLIGVHVAQKPHVNLKYPVCHVLVRVNLPAFKFALGLTFRQTDFQRNVVDPPVEIIYIVMYLQNCSTADSLVMNMFNKLNRFKNSSGQIWLNIASSTIFLDGAVNVDNYIFINLIAVYPVVKYFIPKKYRENIDKYVDAKDSMMLLRHDCRKPLPFPDACIDHILCSHFLEHVYPEEMINILRDFYRKLKPDGTLHVIVPDLKRQAEIYLHDFVQGSAEAANSFLESTLLSRKSRGTFKYRILEFMGGYGLQHRWMYDHLSMKKYISQVNFKILSKNDTPSKNYRLNDDSVHIVASKS